MSDELTRRLETLDQGVDFADPNTYTALLYPEEATATVASQAETTAAPAPAAAPASAPAAPAPAPVEAAAPAAAPAVDSSAPAAAAQPTGAEVAGVMTRDGKNFLPFAVLESTRARARELAETNDRLQRELQALKEGQSTVTSQADAAAAVEALDLSDDELADLEEQIPAVGKLAKGFKALQLQLQAVQSTAAPAPAPTAEDPATSVQALIDQHPLLARWQAKGGAIWSEAVALDQQLRDNDPAFKALSTAERFAEVQRRIAAEYGIPIPSSAPPTPAPAAPAAQPPAPAVQSSTVLPTLTDFNGGQVAVVDPMASLPAGQMVDKAREMSLEELRRMVGISY